MAGYQDKIDVLLNAILAKDVDDIVARKVNIPSLERNYTKQQLQAWLDKRINLLENAKKLTKTQAESAKSSAYGKLSPQQKLKADKLFQGGDVTKEAGEDYENLLSIKLYKFITE